MPKCTNKGCGKDFEDSQNDEGSCSYHPGGPVFHEGLKSWSCCSDVNKPVMEFDQFMSIPTCTTGKHSSAPPVSATASSTSSTSTPPTTAPSFTMENGVETYGVTPKPPTSTAQASATTAIRTEELPDPSANGVKPPEEDDLSIPVPEGSKCKRLACGATWEGEEISRGEGSKAKCRFHSQAPVFHEGSKGYLCCKRRVLEFDEFLKIEGCTDGKHLFVGAKKDENQEEMVSCRLDHYQTPLQVHVSAFAKAADKDRSTVRFEPQQLHLDLYLPNNKRVLRTLTLYGPIDPSKSTYRLLSTKVDIVLVKPNAASWPLLELPPPGTELPKGYALTFGVTGRTGTIGSKEIVLAPEEMAKRM